MSKTIITQFLSQHGMYYGDLNFETECQKFIAEMEKGLSQEGSSLDMIPTYLSVKNNIDTNVPAVVIDAGGTNFRVGLVSFDDNMQPSISDFSKTRMPGIERELSKQEFFGTLVDYTKDVAAKSTEIGFCFSYPTQINKDKDGLLLRWSKEVKAPEVVGEMIGANLVEGLKEVDGKDRNVAILNDTVATLLGGKGITSERNFDGYIGFIFGTGTNLCYIEDSSKITKITDAQDDTMIINTESGAYNKLPRGAMDKVLDESSNNPGDYQLEKMISGRYLGPLVQEVLKGAAKEGIFSTGCNEKVMALENLELIDVSLFVAHPHNSENVLVQCIEEATDCTLMYELIDAMIERAAKISAIKLSACILKTGAGRDQARPVAIVGEGTTFYKLKDYRQKLDFYMRSHLTKEHGHYYEFIQGEDLNLIGTAIAALAH
ncbi:hypothetical protein PBV87_04325 [Niameybacter massiliensis]|uniref:Hexokinase n=1 Tax=Holtiella tumoricola TaxID=3018743 RepID=A0AA42J008_9FIRM|nr:hypothetical protein [Holtiella tumoricola]MDA3730726.1 hypothetical protein [Holtiella tumoricola]